MAQFRPALSDITTYSSFANPNVAYAGALKPGSRAAAPSAGAASAVAPAGVAAPAVPALPAAAVVHADARNCDDFVEGVMENLRAEQSRGKVPENHLQICQTEVTDKMRAILIDWLVDVHLKYKCRPETIYLAVNLLDRYLSRKVWQWLCTRFSCLHTHEHTRTHHPQAVEKKKLQLVGCVAMMLACKYEEVVPPEVRDFVHISANTYTRGEMLAVCPLLSFFLSPPPPSPPPPFSSFQPPTSQMEKSVLVELGYNLTVPTMWQFLTQLIGGERTDTMRHGAEYLAEQTLMCAKMAGFPPSLQVRRTTVSHPACLTLMCRLRTCESAFCNLPRTHTHTHTHTHTPTRPHRLLPACTCPGRCWALPPCGRRTLRTGRRTARGRCSTLYRCWTTTFGRCACGGVLLSFSLSFLQTHTHTHTHTGASSEDLRCSQEVLALALQQHFPVVRRLRRSSVRTSKARAAFVRVK